MHVDGDDNKLWNILNIESIVGVDSLKKKYMSFLSAKPDHFTLFTRYKSFK